MDIIEFRDMYYNKYPNAENLLTLFSLYNADYIVQKYFDNGEREMYIDYNENLDGGELKFKP